MSNTYEGHLLNVIGHLLRILRILCQHNLDQETNEQLIASLDSLACFLIAYE